MRGFAPRRSSSPECRQWDGRRPCRTTPGAGGRCRGTIRLRGFGGLGQRDLTHVEPPSGFAPDRRGSRCPTSARRRRAKIRAPALPAASKYDGSALRSRSVLAFQTHSPRRGRGSLLRPQSADLAFSAPPQRLGWPKPEVGNQCDGRHENAEHRVMTFSPNQGYAAHNQGTSYKYKHGFLKQRH